MNDQPGSPSAMSSDKKSLLVVGNGKNLVVTFTLVSSLFLLWGFCSGDPQLEIKPCHIPHRK